MTHIVLLRGEMPVGKNKVPMARLREVLTKAKFKNARTYIASGNALVDSDLKARDVEKQVHDLIQKHIGPDLTVIVRNAKELQRLLDENPFGKGYPIDRVFFTSFAEYPPATKIKEILKEDFGEEELRITKRGLYMFIPGSAARSKLSVNFLERKLGVSMTARNFNTIMKLIAMAKEEAEE
jgi:uncharacterized protein (DUF1697 family)